MSHTHALIGVVHLEIEANRRGRGGRGSSPQQPVQIVVALARGHARRRDLPVGNLAGQR